MRPASFEYFAPKTLDEALSLLDNYGEDAKILAGGQSLSILMRFRLARPKYVIDINRLQELEFIRETDEGLMIGALTRMNDIADSTLIKEKHPIIHDAVINIADPLVRNRGTIGGNLSHGDPANDMPAVMIALDATYIVKSSKGERRIKASDFYIDTFLTALKPNEILTSILIPKPDEYSGSAYVKVKRKAGDYAMSAVAVYLALEKPYTIKKIRVALTNVGPKPLKVDTDKFVGNVAEERTFEDIAIAAYNTAQPKSDLRGSSEYKKELTRVLTLRSLRLALSRARGG